MIIDPEDLGSLKHRSVCVGSIQGSLSIGCRDFHWPVGMLLREFDCRVLRGTAGASELNTKGFEPGEPKCSSREWRSQEPDCIHREQHPEEPGDGSDNV